MKTFIAPALDLMPCLQAQGTRDCNKAIKFKNGAINCCYEKKNLFPKTYVWRIFYSLSSITTYYVFELKGNLLYSTVRNTGEAGDRHDTNLSNY